MSHHTRVNLIGETLEPSGDVITGSNGRTFIVFQFNPAVSVILPGFDDDAAANARQCAATLTALAEELDRNLIREAVTR